jgi:hypothetical protein
MKRFVGIFVVLALAGMFSACDSSNTTTDGSVVLPDNAGVDVKDNGGTDGVTVDTPRDTPTVDTNGVDNPPPPDTGVDVPVVTDVPVVSDPGTDVTGCFDDPEGSCKALYACSGDCNQDATGDACRQECQAKLSAKGLADFQAFNTCLQQNCASATTNEEYYACIDTKCINQYYGCFWGCQYDGCPALVGCLNGCPDDVVATPENEQQVCVGNCWGGGTSQAQIDLQNVITCANNACVAECPDNPTPAQTTACNTCFNNALDGGACVTQWDKCVAYGTDKCGAMLTCAFACADGPCTQACLSNGTKTAGTLWNAMIGCANDACVAECPENGTPEQNTACNTCFNAAINQGGACADKTLACQNDAAAQ